MTAHQKSISSEVMDGHGGKAWHQNVIGNCKYSGCQCMNLKPKEATIYPKDDHNKFKFITGEDFIKLYNAEKENIVFT